MKLRKIEFQGFGCLVNQKFEFKDGINIVEANNESGKSTFIKGIHALLFGPTKEGVKRRTKADWVVSFKPWKAEQYGGTIEYLLGDQSYRIVRNLDFPKDSKQIIHLEKGDITKEFAKGSDKKTRWFIEQQINLSGQQLNRISFLTSSSLQTPNDKDSQVVERLKSLVGSGGGRDTSSAIQWLDKQIDEIGTDKAKTKQYGKKSAELEELEREYKKLEHDYHKYIEDKQKWRQKGEELTKIQQELGKIDERLQKAERLNQLQSELDQTLSKIEKVEIEKSALLEKENKLNDQLTKRNDLVQKIKMLEPPYRVDGEDAQRLSYKLEQQKKTQKQLNELHEKRQQLIARLEVLGPQYDKVCSLEYDDFHQPLLQIEKYITLEEEQSELSKQTGYFKEDELDKLKDDLNQLSQNEESSKSIQLQKEELEQKLAQLNSSQSRQPLLPWVIGMGLGAVASILALFLFPIVSLIPLLATFWSVWKWRQGSKEENSRKSQQMAQIQLLMEEIGLLSTQLQQMKQLEKEIFERWQVTSLFLLHQKYNQLSQWEDNRKRLAQLKEQQLEIRHELEQRLQRYIKSLPAFEPRKWKDILRDFQNEVKQTTEDFHSIKNQEENCSKNIETLHAEMKELDQAIQQWLVRYPTSDLAVINEWVEQTKEIQKLEEQFRLLQQVIEQEQNVKQQEGWEQRVSELQKELKQLEKQKESFKEQLGEVNWEQEYLNIKQEKERLVESEKKVKETYDECKGSWSSRVDRVELLPELKGRLDQLRDELEQLRLERKACEKARELIQKATQNFQGHLAPQLQPLASRWIQSVTNGRYQELFIDPTKGLALSVTTPETGENQEISRLSRGTIDQMIFALRLSLLQFFSNHTSPSVHLPLILDDSFVHFDENRLREALRALKILGENHQILLCTCHTRERKILEEEGVPYHSITLNQII